ncbi:MAG: hypothetical protein NC210_05620 [[Clostridium] fimetarium]|nr:hypothetical protein [Alistipes timonensis]MCM1405885.1 hypothetical protein [[Clostridium] fimetarium]
MKKSFTLKAAALGLAVVTAFGASAARPQLTTAVAMDAKGAAPFAISKATPQNAMHSSKTVTEFAAAAGSVIRPAVDKLDLTAQAASRAFDFYGTWEDAGTLEFTFTQLYKNGFITESAMVKTYPYQKRVHRQNDQQFQIKVADWGAFTAAEGDGFEFPGSELILTVSPAQTESGKVVGVVTTESEGVNLGWQVNFGSQAAPNLIDMYYYDAYTYVSNLAKVNPANAPYVQNYYGSSVYDYGTGKFEIFSSYAGKSGCADIEKGLEWGEFDTTTNKYKEMWDDYIQLSGKFYNYDAEVDADAGYFYRNAGETNGHFKAEYAINDNALAVVKIVNKAIANQAEFSPEFQTMLNEINNPSANMAILTSKNGWFELDVTPYQDGQYSLLFGVTDGVENDKGELSFNGVWYDLYLDGAEFVLDGFAKYKDAFIPGWLKMFGLTTDKLGLPSVYETTCQVEKSDKTAGLYRLRAPFAEYPFNGTFDYMQSMDYLFYNVADPAKALVEPSYLGVYTKAQDTQGNVNTLMMGCATTSIATGVDVKDGFAVLTGNALTCPGANYTVVENGKEKEYGPLATLFWVMSEGGGAMYTVAPSPADFLIETGAVDAIENVEAEGAADANAPVEYFNLQGQKVLNPAAGQLVIKKQGSKVTKIIAQ